MHYCIIPGCRSEMYPDCGVSFHRFPKDEALRQKWVAALDLTKKLNKTSTVCSKHFRKKQYLPNICRPILKKDAVPSKAYVNYNSDEDSGEDQDQGTFYVTVPTIEPTGPAGYITIQQCKARNESSEKPDTNSQSNMHFEESYSVNESAMNPQKAYKRKMEDVGVQTGPLQHPLIDECRHKIKVLQQRDKRRQETIKKLKSRLAMCKKHCALLQAVGDDDDYEIVYVEECGNLSESNQSG